MVIGGISGGTTGSCGGGVWLTQTITAPCNTSASTPNKTTSSTTQHALGRAVQPRQRQGFAENPTDVEKFSAG